MRVVRLLSLVLALSAFLVPAAGAAETTLTRTGGLLTPPQNGDPETIAWRWLNDNKARFGLDANDLDALELTRHSRLPHGVTHFEWTQTVRGIEGLNATVRVNVTRDGQIVNAGGSTIPDLSLSSAKPALSPGTALRIAQRDAGVPAGRPAALDAADLVAIQDPGADRLAWKVTVTGREPLVYTTLVDATTGAVLDRELLTDFADARVFRNHPGAAHGGAQEDVPLGAWLTAPDRLLGPNAYAFADLNDEPDFGELNYAVADAGEDVVPSAAPDYLYSQVSVPAGDITQFCPAGFSAPCSWSGLNDSTLDDNRAQRATQLFYFVNAFHDWLATEVGFNAADGNFEGADRVIAQTDDGNAGNCAHVNNANMTTPGDGMAPQMQMYFFASRCSEALPAVSSSDEAGVVFHEYTHGMSNRLIGNAAGLTANQSTAMGEGWSDWYAMDYLADAANGPLETDTAAAGELAVGKYVTDDTTRGIRRAAIDCPVGSAATACQPVASSAGAGGYTYADLGRVSSSSTSSPHANGEIWAQTLWELRSALGGPIARDRVTEAMRLSPTIEPSFLDMRNAIISADVVAGGANVAAIWAVFAARGMGCGAKSSSADATTTVTAAFDVPAPGQGCSALVPSGTAPAAVLPSSVSNALKTARIDRKGRFKFRFTGAPVGVKGSVAFKTTGKIKSGSKRKILSLGSRPVTVPQGRLVEVQINLGPSTRQKLKSKRKVAVTATITLAGAKFTSPLTLKR